MPWSKTIGGDGNLGLPRHSLTFSKKQELSKQNLFEVWILELVTYIVRAIGDQNIRQYSNTSNTLDHDKQPYITCVRGRLCLGDLFELLREGD